MLDVLLQIYQTLPQELQAVCTSVGSATIQGLIGSKIQEWQQRKPELVFARVCQNWQRGFIDSADAEPFRRAFKDFFASGLTQNEIRKAAMGDYADVDFDRLEGELRVIEERFRCDLSTFDVIDDFAPLVEDLVAWLEELPQYRQLYGVNIERTLWALHGPEGSFSNPWVGRRAYLKRVVEEYQEVNFRGLADVGDDSHIDLRRIYVPPRLVECKARLEAGLSVGNEINARDLLREGSPGRLVVLGKPGGGKSALARWISLHHAAGQLQGWTEPEIASMRLPVVYRLANLTKDLEGAEKSGKPRVLWECLHSRASQLAGKSLPSGFLDLMERRHGLLVFLDGLDEAADQEEAGKVIRAFADTLSTLSRVIVTSRPVEYREHLPSRVYRHYDLQLLDDGAGGEMFRFIKNWHSTRLGDTTEAKNKSKKLWERLKHSDDIRDLARNPLMLTMILRVEFDRGELPRSRIALYQQCAETLLEHWARAAQLPSGPLKPRKKAKFLAELAYSMQNDQKELKRGSLRIPEKALLERLDAFLKHESPATSAEEVVQRLVARDAILVKQGEDKARLKQLGLCIRPFRSTSR
ncbi:MAG: NACHT domain-containing protein [Bryobacterales bacterium]|nr:NACHT domain-containing protein [Bryobacterales bacterium]